MAFLNRRKLLGLLASGLSSPVFGQTTLKPKPAPNRVAAPIRSLKTIMANFAPSGTLSVVVVDVQTGRILEGVSADRAMIPASVTKIATAIYALRTLGSGFRFQTRLVGSGRVENGVLKGNLTLVGGGDPHLDSDGLGQMAEALAARGITRVAGKFQVYSGALPYQRVTDPTQLEHVGYNPSISGLNLNFNRVFFQWRRVGTGYDLTMTAKGKAYAPQIRGIRAVTSSREWPVYDYALVGGRDTWSVSAPAMGKGGSRWLPVRNPADYAGETFRNVAAQNGITLGSPIAVKSIPKGVVLASETGAELSGLARSMLKFSTNLTAEVVGMRASQKRGSLRKLAQSGATMTGWIKKTYRVKTAKFVDHSGLGDKARISAEDMATILVREGWNGPIRPLLKSVDLRNEAWKKAPLPGVRIVAKTGTLNFASALAGYIECRNGRQLAFAIFTQNAGARAAIPPDRRERPNGAKGWARQSRIMQHQLIRRWAREYGGG